MNRRLLIAFGDLVSFIISFILLVFIRFDKGSYISAIHSHIVPFIILYLFWVLIFYVFGLYDLVTIKPTIPSLRRWALALVSSFVVGLLLFYFVPIFGISPKSNLFIQVILFGFFSFFFRRMIYRLFTKTITRPTILIGNSPSLLTLKKEILANPQIGLEVIRHFKFIDDIDLEKEEIKNLLIILDKDTEIDNKNILDFYRKGIKIIDTAEAYEKYLYKIPVEYINLSFIIDEIEVKKDIAYSFLTFLVDKVFAIIILILSSPCLIVSAIFVYLYDKGPILYTQNRVGLGGKIFKLYKIRSMTTDAEKDGAKWSTGANDSRVTPIGRIIRKTHIDEIPQMINILKGDISFVGPRSERPEFVEILNKDIPYYSFRHIIRPGFTGWAQIKYRYARTVDESKEKFEYDLYYIKNRNIFLDIGIILRTIQIIFTH